MPEEIFLLSLFGIVFGSSLVGLVLYGIYNLIMTKMNKGDRGREINPQFFKALSEFKKNTERRIGNLEAVVSDLEQENAQLTEDVDSQGSIEMEDEEAHTPSQKNKTEGGNLRNMLNE
ncbi:MAG: hypothetical protein FH748_05885 [Balneolaceae bacterium]|nr:hypothetical protein [Balneolaceae bacterium]